MSMREQCLALFHQELAEKQKVLLLEDDLTRLILQRCSCNDIKDAQEITKLLITIGQAICWSGTYHTLAKAIVKAFNDEMEMSWNQPRKC